MKKNTFYFSHDYHARSDGKLVKVMMKHGVAGIGIYWCLIEMLYENEGRISVDECERIAFELRTDSDCIASVLRDFDLFNSDGEFFWSESINRRIEGIKSKSIKAKESANLRWNKEKDANVMRTHSDRNANKIKSNEIKSNKIKGNKIKEDEIKAIELSEDNSVHKIFIDEYHNWFVNHFGFKPNYTQADFKAVKLLIKHLNDNTGGDEEKTILAFKYILNNWESLSDFYKSKATLREINSNITKIMIELKNNHNKKSEPVGKFNKQYNDLIEKIKRNG